MNSTPIAQRGTEQSLGLPRVPGVGIADGFASFAKDRDISAARGISTYVDTTMPCAAPNAHLVMWHRTFTTKRKRPEESDG